MGPLRHMSVPRLFPLPTLEILSPDVFTPVSTCLPVSLLVALVSTCFGLLWIHMAVCFYLSPLVPLLLSLLDDFTHLCLLVSLLVSHVSTCLGLLWIRLAG